MKRRNLFGGLAAVLILALSASALAGWSYKVNHKHAGGDVAPIQAMEMIQNDPIHTLLIDVRSRAEYELIGHPVMAYSVPIKFFTKKLGKKGYTFKLNSRFGQDLLDRFNPETDTLLFMCRSGSRSCEAADLAVAAGFKPEKVFNIMGGFEGNKMKSPLSGFNGQRVMGGWRNEGLPWTYHMDKLYLYKPDLKK